MATGREKTELHSPVEIQGAYLGNGIGSVDGRIRFRPRKVLNRPGLLLIDGVLYLALTAHLDGEASFDAHGWVLAYDAKSLKQLSALCTTPDGIQGDIWQSGGGLSAERRDGGPYPLIYAVSANGSVGGRNFAQSILQLFPGALLSVKQTFTPAEQAYQNDRDLDLSTAPLLLPGLPLVVACSKEGRCYVVDRSNMRFVQDLQASINSYGGDRPSNIHGTPVAWRDATSNLWLYVWGEEHVFARVSVRWPALRPGRQEHDEGSGEEHAGRDTDAFGERNCHRERCSGLPCRSKATRTREACPAFRGFPRRPTPRRNCGTASRMASATGWACSRSSVLPWQPTAKSIWPRLLHTQKALEGGTSWCMDYCDPRMAIEMLTL